MTAPLAKEPGAGHTLRGDEFTREPKEGKRVARVKSSGGRLRKSKVVNTFANFDEYDDVSLVKDTRGKREVEVNDKSVLLLRVQSLPAGNHWYNAAVTALTRAIEYRTAPYDRLEQFAVKLEETDQLHLTKTDSTLLMHSCNLAPAGMVNVNGNDIMMLRGIEFLRLGDRNQRARAIIHATYLRVVGKYDNARTYDEVNRLLTRLKSMCVYMAAFDLAYPAGTFRAWVRLIYAYPLEKRRGESSKGIYVTDEDMLSYPAEVEELLSVVFCYCLAKSRVESSVDTSLVVGGLERLDESRIVTSDLVEFPNRKAEIHKSRPKNASVGFHGPKGTYFAIKMESAEQADQLAQLLGVDAKIDEYDGSTSKIVGTTEKLISTRMNNRKMKGTANVAIAAEKVRESSRYNENVDELLANLKRALDNRYRKTTKVIPLSECRRRDGLIDGIRKKIARVVKNELSDGAQAVNLQRSGMRIEAGVAPMAVFLYEGHLICDLHGNLVEDRMAPQQIGGSSSDSLNGSNGEYTNGDDMEEEIGDLPRCKTMTPRTPQLDYDGPCIYCLSCGCCVVAGCKVCGGSGWCECLSLYGSLGCTTDGEADDDLPNPNDQLNGDQGEVTNGDDMVRNIRPQPKHLFVPAGIIKNFGPGRPYFPEYAVPVNEKRCCCPDNCFFKICYLAYIFLIYLALEALWGHAEQYIIKAEAFEFKRVGYLKNRRTSQTFNNFAWAKTATEEEWSEYVKAFDQKFTWHHTVLETFFHLHYCEDNPGWWRWYWECEAIPGAPGDIKIIAKFNWKARLSLDSYMSFRYVCPFIMLLEQDKEMLDALSKQTFDMKTRPNLLKNYIECVESSGTKQDYDQFVKELMASVEQEILDDEKKLREAENELRVEVEKNEEILTQLGVNYKLSQLNGTNGEYTNGDDMPPKIPHRQAPALNARKVAQALNNALAANAAAPGAVPAPAPPAPPPPPRLTKFQQFIVDFPQWTVNLANIHQFQVVYVDDKPAPVGMKALILAARGVGGLDGLRDDIANPLMVKITSTLLVFAIAALLYAPFDAFVASCALALWYYQIVRTWLIFIPLVIIYPFNTAAITSIWWVYHYGCLYFRNRHAKRKIAIATLTLNPRNLPTTRDNRNPIFEPHTINYFGMWGTLSLHYESIEYNPGIDFTHLILTVFRVTNTPFQILDNEFDLRFAHSNFQQTGSKKTTVEASIRACSFAKGGVPHDGMDIVRNLLAYRTYYGLLFDAQDSESNLWLGNGAHTTSPWLCGVIDQGL